MNGNAPLTETTVLYATPTMAAVATGAAPKEAAPSPAGNGQSDRTLSPEERERQKTPEEQARAVVYTANHAVMCLAVTDAIVEPLIGAVVSSISGKKQEVHLCAGNHKHDHDHKHEHAHGHEHHHHDHANIFSSEYWEKFGKASYWEQYGTSKFWNKMFKNSGVWFISEAVGDISAVPVTIAAQRLAPGFMEGIREKLEPMVGGFYKRRADDAAQKWGAAQGYSPDSQEVSDRSHMLYEYEVEHLPKMAVWTVSSIFTNFATMKMLDNDKTFLEFVKGKSLGAAITASLVVGVRSASPNAAHAWDESVGKHFVLPVVKGMSKLFGVEEKHVDTFYENKAKHEREERTPVSQDAAHEKTPTPKPSKETPSTQVATQQLQLNTPLIAVGENACLSF